MVAPFADSGVVLTNVTRNMVFAQGLTKAREFVSNKTFLFETRNPSEWIPEFSGC